MKRKIFLLFIFLHILHINPLYSVSKIIPFAYNGSYGLLNEKFEMISSELFMDIKNIGERSCVVFDTLNGENRNRILFYDGTFIEFPRWNYVFYIGDEYIGINWDNNMLHHKTDINQVSKFAFPITGPHTSIELELSGINTICLGGENLDFIYCRPHFGVQIQTQKGKLLWNEKIYRLIWGSVQDDLFVAETMDYEYLLLNTKGEILKKTNFTYLGSFYNGLAPGFKYPELIRGYYNTDLQLVFAVENFPEYPDNFVCDVLPVYIKDGKKYMFDAFDQKIAEDLDWALVDTKGNLRVRGIKAGKISNFSEDKVAVFVRNNNGEFEYQLIDTQGKIITQKLYDEIKDSINGYCMAKRDGIDYLISAEDGTEYKCEDFLK